MTALTLPLACLPALIPGGLPLAPEFQGGSYVPFDDVALLSAGPLEVLLNGNAAFSAPDISMQLDDDGLHAEVGMRGALTVDLAAGLSGDFAEEITTGVAPLPPFSLGNNVLVEPFVWLTVRIEGSAEAGMRVAFVQQFETSASIAVGSGIDTQMDEVPSFTHRYAKPELSGATGADVSVATDANIVFVITVNGVFVGGPAFTASVGMDLGMDPLADPWWDLDGVIEVRGGAYLGPVLFEETLYATTFDIADAGAPFPVQLPAPTRWSSAFDMGSNERASSVIPLEDGAIVVGPGSGPGGGGWFAKLDEAGEPVWQEGAVPVPDGSSRPEEAHSTSDGGFLVGSNQGVGFAPRLERFAADGSLLWTRSYADAQGDVLALGSVIVLPGDAALFCGRVARLASSIPVVVLVDANGGVVAAFELNMPGIHYAAFRQIIPSAAGGWILAGWASYQDEQVPPTISSRNGLVTRFDASGALVFNTIFGGPGYDQLYSVAEDEFGTVCAAGEHRDGNAPIAWLLGLDAGGTKAWTGVYGSSDNTGHDGLLSIDATSGGGFVVAGYTRLGAERNTVLFQVDRRGMPVWWKTFLSPEADEPSEVRWTENGPLLGGWTNSLDLADPPLSDIWILRTNVDGMVHFADNAPFHASNPKVKWEGADLATVAAGGSLVPIEVTSEALVLQLVPTAATHFDLAE